MHKDARWPTSRSSAVARSLAASRDRAVRPICPPAACASLISRGSSPVPCVLATSPRWERTSCASIHRTVSDTIARGAAADTLLGKRSVFLDLTATTGRATLHDLLESADVVVCSYRPGALDRFGVSADELAVRHPGLVIVQLDAWGFAGPWSERRGFDSVVQAPTGIAMLQSSDGDTPGALPFQLLDHGTGYLAAAAALDGLRRQAVEGGTHRLRLSLARTAHWLTSARAMNTGVAESPAVDPAPWMQRFDERGHATNGVSPPGTIDGVPLRWPHVGRYGTDGASWMEAN